MMVALGVLLSLNANAYDVQIDGIYYNLLSDAKAAVTSGDNKYTGDITIPSSFDYNGTTYNVTSIGYHAFWNCSGLTSVDIPSSVTSIGYEAFLGCTGLTFVNIPNSVTSIGGSAFERCSGLTSVTIPNSVTYIEQNAFYNCSGLTSIVVDKNNTVYDSREDCNAIINTATNTLVTGCVNTIIPNSVTYIEQNAFYGCSSLTSVTIPNSVKNIEEYAFSGCRGLTSIDIPNSVTNIDESAFCDCRGLTSIDIPNSVTNIDESAFRDCSGLTSVVIPNSVTSIGGRAFENCSSLASVTIPNSVTSIGYEAFLGCTLTSINITDIAAWCKPAVSNFNSSSTTYPRTGCHLLLNGEEIKDLDIPESVTEIGTKAFSICPSITSVKVHWNRPLAGGADSFQPEVRKKATLYVPKGTAMMYMAASGWSEFANIMEFEDGDDAHYITIRMGEGGALKQSVEVGKVYTYAVSADEGWSVNTITFDGKDMTSILMDGQFSTPVITGNSELNVVFRQGDSSDTKGVAAASDVKVYARANTVTITGAENDAPVAVYNMGGVKVKSAVGNATLSLDSGAYIIKVGNEAFKVSM